MEFYATNGSIFIQQKKFIEAGGFDERISIFEDLALDLKFMNICIYAYTPEIVYEHYCEYAELSLTPKPLNKFFPYYIQITNQSFFFEKLMLYSVTLATYYKFKKWNDQKACNYLMSNILLRHKHLYIIHQIYSKYKQYRKQILLSKDKKNMNILYDYQVLLNKVSGASRSFCEVAHILRSEGNQIKFSYQYSDNLFFKRNIMRVSSISTPTEF